MCKLFMIAMVVYLDTDQEVACAADDSSILKVDSNVKLPSY